MIMMSTFKLLFLIIPLVLSPCWSNQNFESYRLKIFSSLPSTSVFLREVEMFQRDSAALKSFHWFLGPLCMAWLTRNSILIHPNESTCREEGHSDEYAIFFSGALVEVENYRSMVTKLVDKLLNETNGKLRLHVLIIPWRPGTSIFSYSKPYFLNAAVNLLARDSKSKMGDGASNPLKIEDVWAIGHSAGSFECLEFGSKFMKGVISYAGLRSSQYSIIRKPILHVCCEYDGFFPMSLFSKLLYADYSNFSPHQNTHAILDGYRKSLKFDLCNVVAVARNVNHLDICGNILPTATAKSGRRDLNVPIKSDALETLCSIACNFLLYHSANSVSDESRDACQAALIHYKQDSFDYFYPFLRVYDANTDLKLVEDWNKFLKDKMLAVYQEEYQQLNLPKLLTINPKLQCQTVELSSCESFLRAKPLVEYEREGRELFISSAFLRMHSVENLMTYTGEARVSIAPTCQSIGSILAIKSPCPSKVFSLLASTDSFSKRNLKSTYLSESAIFKIFDNAIAEFNTRTMNEALKTVPKDVRDQYERSGRKLVFGSDFKVIKGAPEWLSTKVEIVPLDISTQSDDNRISRMSSPYANVPFIPSYLSVGSRFAGTFYAKIITFGFALEWIYFWSKR